jgi:PAS domain S-box-containing protein
VTPDLDDASTEVLAAWLAAVREAATAEADEAAARAFELEAHRVERELQNRELRRTQAALTESNARYRDLYDLAPVAYLTVGRDGAVQEANQTAATLLGVEREHLIGRPLAARVVARDRDVLRKHLQRCFEAAVQVDTEVRVAVRGRDPVIAHVISVPIFAGDGTLVGCRTTLADISLIKRSEVRLGLLARASLLLAAPLVDDVPYDEVLRLLVADFADLAALDLLDANGRLRPVSLACSSMALERRAAALAPSAGWLEAGIPAALAGGEPVFLPDCSPATLLGHGLGDEPLLAACGATSALLLPVRSRTTHFGVLTLAVLDWGRRFDAPDRIVAQDLATRLALALDNARLYREAREAIKAREEMLAFVAHDLRNPVHAILLSLAGLLDGSPEAKEERRRGWHRLDRVRRTTEQMNRLIDDLLDLASLDAGRLAIETGEHDMLDILREAQESLGPLVEEKGIHLDVELPPGPLAVRCDRGRTLQALSGIVGNAIKFTPRGGRITIVSRPAAEGVELAIADSGPAVAPADLERLFDRHWQADEPAHKARGLGLYVVRKIVEAHEGRIWAKSEPGRGTTIHLTLPRSRALAGPEISSPAPSGAATEAPITPKSLAVSRS